MTVIKQNGARTKKSAQRRDAILARATELFDRKGFANTSLDDIARAVGITREGIYYYFKNRSEILLTIVKPQSQGLVDGLRAIIDDPELDHGQRLQAAIRNHLERFDRYCLEMTVSLRDGYFDDSDHDVHAVMNGFWKAYEQMWTELVQAGQLAGAFRAAGDPKMIAFAILGMCNWLARWYDPKGSTSIEDLIGDYCDVIANGLFAAPGRSRGAAVEEDVFLRKRKN
jgi:TetR/AcrR family transcriptional regulator, cholesterol catabolism regulator